MDDDSMVTVHFTSILIDDVLALYYVSLCCVVYYLVLLFYFGLFCLFFFFFSSRRRHTRSLCDWSSDVCSSDLSLSGALDTSIVIRTCLVLGRDVYFQVGGGIVADSDPEQEYRETLDKAQG